MKSFNGRQTELLRMSTSSPSLIFEAFVPAFVVGEKTIGIQSSCLRTETKHLKIQDGEDVDVLRRPGL